MNGCKVAMAEHSSQKRAGVAGSAMLSQLKLNHFHDLHSLYLSQKQVSLEGSQPLRADILKGMKMIHEMTLGETVRNKTSREKKTEIPTERDQSDSSDLFAVDLSSGATSRQYIV